MEFPSIDDDGYVNATTTLEELDMTIQFHARQTRQAQPPPAVAPKESSITAFLRSSKGTAPMNDTLNNDNTNHTSSTLGTTSCSPDLTESNEKGIDDLLDELDVDLDLNSLGDHEEYEVMLNDASFSKIQEDFASDIPVEVTSIDRLNEAFENMAVPVSSHANSNSNDFCLRPSAQYLNSSPNNNLKESNLLRVFQRQTPGGSNNSSPGLNRRPSHRNALVKSSSNISLKLGRVSSKETFVKARSLAYLGPKSAMLARRDSNNSLSSSGSNGFKSFSNATFTKGGMNKAKASMQLRGLLMRDFKKQSSSSSIHSASSSGGMMQRSAVNPQYNSSGMAVPRIRAFQW